MGLCLCLKYERNEEEDGFQIPLFFVLFIIIRIDGECLKLYKSNSKSNHIKD